MAIRAIIFDCFGVIYSEGKGYIQALCPPDKQTDLHDLYTQVDRGFISGADFVARASQLIGIGEVELRQTIDEKYIRNESLFDMVRAYKNDYKTGLLSNVGDDLIDRLFTPAEKSELFDAIILSSSVGVTKPSARIYEIAIERLGVSAEECIMIDDIVANVEGAEIVGMHGVLFTSNRALEQELADIIEVNSVA